MWIADSWTDYRLLDAADGYRLEAWGPHILARPDPQVIWQTGRTHPDWSRVDARYTRSEAGGGAWSAHSLPDKWQIHWRGLPFIVRPTGFKHTGLFPEQAANWDFVQRLIESRARPDRPFRLLNLFAYTGGATVAAARAGAFVTHVDAAKGMVAWARDNAALSGVEARWLVDDCTAFVARELRRGNVYDGIIMDPPSYGRGPNGQTWKLEDDLYGFLVQAAGLLSPDAQFMLINSYTTGLAPSVLETLLQLIVRPRFGGRTEARELGLPVESTGINLPCGASGRWIQS